MKPIIKKYADACSYPGVLDEQAVERALQQYLDALGEKRTIVRLRLGWSLSEHPSLEKFVRAVLDDFSKRKSARAALDALDALDARDARDARAARDALDALDARAARDARDARDALDALDARAARDARDARDAEALQRFAQWCVQGGFRWSWWWYREVSYLAATHIGAVELGHKEVDRWAKPAYDAFLAGAWLIHFTEDTLYWVAKPTVHTEPMPQGGKRMHNANGAALESDVEPLFFWHGVLVPDFVVLRPQEITLQHIADADNAEVRRVLLERYGYERYITDLGAKREQADDYGELYRVERSGDTDLVMVRVINSTAEPDGSFKRYMLRVPPTVHSAREGVAWTFGIENPEHYEPAVQT